MRGTKVYLALLVMCYCLSLAAYLIDRIALKCKTSLQLQNFQIVYHLLQDMFSLVLFHLCNFVCCHSQIYLSFSKHIAVLLAPQIVQIFPLPQCFFCYSFFPETLVIKAQKQVLKGSLEQGQTQAEETVLLLFNHLVPCNLASLRAKARDG